MRRRSDIGFYGVSNNYSGQYYQQDAYHLSLDYGPAGFVVRHALNVTGEYELPLGRGKRFGAKLNHVFNEAVGGWKLSGSDVTYSGFTLTVGSPANYSSLVYRFTGAARPNQNRPLKVVNISLNAYYGTNVQAGTPGYACGPNADNGSCVFSQQLNDAFGDVRPGSLRAPRYEQIDMSLVKSFNIYHEYHVDFRGDFFILFNIASYLAPDSGVTHSSFGQITNTNSTERQIQLSLNTRSSQRLFMVETLLCREMAPHTVLICHEP